MIRRVALFIIGRCSSQSGEYGMTCDKKRKPRHTIHTHGVWNWNGLGMWRERNM